MSGEHIKQAVKVCLGKAGHVVGSLTYVLDGRRQYSQFAYDAGWLTDRDRFEISPDLPLIDGHQNRRAPTHDESCFHFRRVRAAVQTS